MEQFGRELALTLVILFFMLAGPGTALIIVTQRKRRARAVRRAPIERLMLRGAGESLRKQIDEVGDDVMSYVVGLQVIPVAILAIFLAQSLVRGLGNMLVPGAIYGLFALSCCAFLVFRLLKSGARLDNLQAGFDAELAVGQELDQLMLQGARVFHDFPAEGFNIDHVVVAGQGVFAVETKGLTKVTDGDARSNAVVRYDGTTLKFPRWTSREHLDQAERQSKWLERWLASATSESIPVIPVLALPGWFVEQTGVGTTKVFSGRQLSRLLSVRGARTLTPAEIQRVAHQLERSCRTVSPRYVEPTKAT